MALREQILAFVSKATQAPLESIKMTDEIVNDFGLGSLDIHIFYEEFIEAFEVAVPEDYDEAKYVIENSWFAKLKSKSIFGKEGKVLVKEISVKQLLEMAKSRTWHLEKVNE